MILLQPRRMTLRHYLDTLAEYELPGSTANTKLLGPPFVSGRVSITYAEPGLAVMRSEIQLGEEMMVMKPVELQASDPTVDVMHYFAFTSIAAGEGISSVASGAVVEMATGAQDLITYFANDNPTVLTYPPGYHTNSVLIQAAGWWLAEHMPGLAAQFAKLKEQGGIKHVMTAPTIALQKLAMYRDNFNTPLPFGEESSSALVQGFLVYCNCLIYSDTPETDTVATPPTIAQKIDALVQEIMQNIHKPLPSVAEMSERSGINIHTLRVNFMKYYGQSAADYFAARQMAWAEEELMKNATVKSVGYRIGYQNLSHFAANFKKYRGRFPGELTGATRH